VWGVGVLAVCGVHNEYRGTIPEIATESVTCTRGPPTCEDRVLDGPQEKRAPMVGAMSILILARELTITDLHARTTRLQGYLAHKKQRPPRILFFFFITMGLELSDTKVYAPEIRALLGTASYFCEAVVLKLRTVPNGTTLGSRILPVVPTVVRPRIRPSFGVVTG